MAVVHRCRFVEYMPSAIRVLAMSPVGNAPLLAVSRSDGTVEILDGSQDWLCQRRIVLGGQSAESMAWIGDYSFDGNTYAQGEGCDHFDVRKKRLWKDARPAARLFTAGLDGHVVEWDLEKLAPKSKTDSSGGGAIWCMAASPDQKRLAVGCEDGSVNIYKVRRKRLEYERSLGKQQGCVLSIAWREGFIAAGTIDGLVVIFDYATGRSAGRITVEKGVKIWTLMILGDGTLVTGGSNGLVQFWDRETRTLMHTYNRMQADVLAMVSHPTMDRIFVTGSDHKIVELTLNKTEKSPSWMETGSRRTHSHDLKSLSMGYLPCGHVHSGKMCMHLVRISGGVDTRVFIADYSTNKSKLERHLVSYVQRQIVHVAKNELMAAALGSKIVLWKLGIGKQMLQVKTPANEQTVCSAMSQDGTLLAYSTPSNLRILRIDLSIPKIEKITVNVGSAVLQMIFVGDTLSLATLNNVFIYQLEANSAVLMHSIPISFCPVSIAADKNHVCLIGIDSRVHLFDLAREKEMAFEFEAAPVTASLGYSHLVVVTQDNRLHIFSSEGTPIKTSNIYPQWWLDQSDPILGVAWRSSSVISLWSHGFICRIDLSVPVVAHQKRLQSQDKPGNLQIVHKYRPVIGMDWIDENVAVVVERPWGNVLAQLPPAFYKPKYGHS